MLTKDTNMNQPKELKERKPTRLKNFDYSTTASYFITICTENRKNILSKIVGEGSPLPKLSQYGEISNTWIRRLPTKYPQISVDCYIIMPNHIHLLLSLSQDSGRGDPSPTINSAIGWLKYNITKEINQNYIGTTKKIFQRSFYDHIVRNYDDYYEIHKYICENPIRWQFDKLYNKE